MAAESNLKNMLLCLTLTCLLCSAVLGGVYVVTKDLIAQAEQAELEASLRCVVPDGSEISAEPVTLTLDGISCECYLATGPQGQKAYAVKSSVNGFGGPLTVLVGIYDGKVFSTKVLTHSETPGLGAKCSEADSPFVLQFNGFDFGGGAMPALKKDGGSLDAITASTITSRAYTLAVANAVKLINENYGNE